ncbi:hypothetical protein HQ312_12415 [Rhodococcus sp. BP-316]|uniref:hypothetical protein n=1 Tax=Rhodococcus sp. BP-316 TaxID=2739445 RepID=UPI001C9B038F|nr:hypothetical protein [Rhodococcus sp. BP-316]MBY6681857.1 hypothetical protein [Rhodococcus sp. BP-316]
MSSVYTFDASGSLVGAITGPAIYANSVSSLGDKLASTSSKQLTLTTPSGQSEFAIGFENIVQASTSDKRAGTATYWYNSGMVSGIYTNSYASISSQGELFGGTVNGLTRTVAQCGDLAYSIIQDIATGVGEESTRSGLYRADSNGIRLTAAWDYPADFKPISRTAACGPNGEAIYALYADNATLNSQNGMPGLTLARVDTSTGSRTDTPLGMAGLDWSVVSGTMSVLDGRAYWINAAKEVLSVDLSDAAGIVRREWSLPGVEGNAVASVDNGKVDVVVPGRNARYSQHDLRTGATIGTPIALPWLDALTDASPVSGQTLVDVASLE